MKNLLVLFALLISLSLRAQSVNYPYPVHYLQLTIEGQPVRMAYMDVPAEKANGKTLLLLHGKNFNGFYWKEVIPYFTARGYRVVVPDQVGWGLSDKPDLHYSFHGLAENTRKLLDTLRIERVQLLGHSMGGMLATRFALLYPNRVEQLILENPIGLEDYRTFVPYQPLDSQLAADKRSDYAALRKYQQSYYPQWKPEYEQYVAAQFFALQAPDAAAGAKASALTYAMIYEQPVVYEFRNLKLPTLLIIGQGPAPARRSQKTGTIPRPRPLAEDPNHGL